MTVKSNGQLSPCRGEPSAKITIDRPDLPAHVVQRMQEQAALEAARNLKKAKAKSKAAAKAAPPPGVSSSSSSAAGCKRGAPSTVGAIDPRSAVVPRTGGGGAASVKSGGHGGGGSAAASSAGAGGVAATADTKLTKDDIQNFMMGGDGVADRRRINGAFSFSC
jgi:hypothetical protein